MIKNIEISCDGSMRLITVIQMYMYNRINEYVQLSSQERGWLNELIEKL